MYTDAVSCTGDVTTRQIWLYTLVILIQQHFATVYHYRWYNSLEISAGYWNISSKRNLGAHKIG